MKQTRRPAALASPRIERQLASNSLHFIRRALTTLALCGSALFSLSAVAQAGLVRWVFDPAIAPTAWIAGDTISIGYTVTSSSQTDSADLIADLRVKRNDDQAFQQGGNYKICVGFDGVCSTVIMQFSVSSGLSIANISGVIVPPTAFREGRQLWIRRLVGTDPNVEDANVRTAYLDIVPTLPNGPDAVAGCRLDVDGDGELRSETDGLMIQRYLMGYRGSALIANIASPPAAARKTASTIQKHLESSNYSLNGVSAPATDAGIILARYLGGLRGTALVGGISGRSASSVTKLIEERVNFTNGIDECSLQQLGILSFTIGSIERLKIPVLIGSSTTVPVSFVPRQGVSAAEFVVTFESGASVGTMVNASTLRITSGVLSPQRAAYVRFRLTHVPSGRYVIRSARVEPVPVTFSSMGNVSATGGTLVDSLGATVNVSSNSLPNTVTATLREGLHDATTRIIEIEFSQNVRNLGLAVTFRRPAVNLQPDATLAGNAELKSGATQLTTFDPLSITVPYSVDSTRLGTRWQEFRAMYVPRSGLTETIRHRLPDGAAVSCEIACTLDGTRLSVTERTSAELRATIPSTSPPLFGVTSGFEYEPVLFVHGFTQDPLGGGSGTWGRFPALVRDSADLVGKKFVPFEFRWNTNARFRDVAGDLVDAINLIRTRTGKRVHVVAHSFGGLLIRSVIQKRNDDVVAPVTVSLPNGVSEIDAQSARTSVASVVTLGSPHSGIADTNGDTVPGTGVALPLGQDAATFNGCEFTTCHEAGEKIGLFSPVYLSALQLPSYPGDWVATLANTANNLPSIPFAVGIGLTSHRFALNDPVLRNGRWDEGDFLISYKGQRFHPTFTAGGAIRGIALRNGSSGVTGQASLYEVVLGSRRDVAPGEELDLTEKSQTPRRYGYLHSTTTGARNAGPTSDDDGLEFGIEAAPRHTDCAVASTCQHAGWLLFKHLQLGRYCEFTEAGCSEVRQTTKRLGLGQDYSCAVASGGIAKCWGLNSSGQLGDGTTSNRLLPVPVVGIPSTVVMVAAGYSHACGKTSSGGAYCWGANYSGQLGDRSQAMRLSAVPVYGLAVGVVDITAGGSHSCALLSGGVVRCWGENFNGQISATSPGQVTEPVTITGVPADGVAIVAGINHTCLLRTSGAYFCWGSRDYLDALGPATSSGVAALSAGGNFFGGHSCAVSTSGSVVCWGNNSNYQLGALYPSSSQIPITAISSNALGVAAGAYHTCATTSGGVVKCWGNNGAGQLGSSGSLLLPTAVPGLLAQEVFAGNYHTCAVQAAGTVLCWGSNASGQLGDGTNTGRASSALVSGLLVNPIP